MVNVIMEQLDLNLDNYQLNDLLKLFKLSMNFNEDELKEAKKIVHLVHPDKSGLDSKYFIFYKKAYDLVSHIYKVNHRNINEKVSNVSYETLRKEYSQTDRLKAVQQLQKSGDFNKHFNDLFDEYYIRDEDGYGDWLKNNDESLSYTDLKQQSRELALKSNIGQLVAKGSYSSFDTPNSYSSDQYSDLREIYTTGSVIGVDEHLDFDKVKKYSSVEELKKERSQVIKPLSEDESRKILHHQQVEENEQSINRIYNLTKEHEQHQKKQTSYWSKFLSLSF